MFPARLTATLVAATLLSSPALAQSTDVSTIKCADLATMDADGIATLMIWVDGFMGGAAEDPTFDLDRLGTNMDGAGTICANNPDMSVMDALAQAEGQ
ncbi:HdeA/HdeB family chaperone [Gemmobacter denitrificans]|uniref:HdeA/HdeB family chaperone n=1 Tax=Gemmobacter denitrificans TaxID=3123040 RepID=A0ABU8BUK1_9RHOB